MKIALKMGFKTQTADELHEQISLLRIKPECLAKKKTEWYKVHHSALNYENNQKPV